METPVGRDGGGGLQEEEPTRLKEDPHSGDKEDGMGLMTARAGDRK